MNTLALRSILLGIGVSIATPAFAGAEDAPKAEKAEGDKAEGDKAEKKAKKGGKKKAKKAEKEEGTKAE